MIAYKKQGYKKKQKFIIITTPSAFEKLKSTR